MTILPSLEYSRKSWDTSEVSLLGNYRIPPQRSVLSAFFPNLPACASKASLHVFSIRKSEGLCSWWTKSPPLVWQESPWQCCHKITMFNGISISFHFNIASLKLEGHFKACSVWRKVPSIRSVTILDISNTTVWSSTKPCLWVQPLESNSVLVC